MSTHASGLDTVARGLNFLTDLVYPESNDSTMAGFLRTMPKRTSSKPTSALE